ncbi:hypothetical protein LCGC14_2089870 [marine sediment metagenome]|uniref:Uncharacterized protein n=1 Tax=marine sediment metagenome TaxID=412755 RepID=A0A0F9GR83_9ZZZZ
MVRETLNNLTIGFITLGVAFLIGGAMTLVISEIGDDLQTTNSSLVSNETGAINTTGYYVVVNYRSDFVSIDTSSVRITTHQYLNNSVPIASGNYTAFSNGSIIQSSKVSAGINMSEPFANITYTFTLNNNPTEFLVAKNGSAGMVKLASFGTIFGIIIAVVIILGIIALAVTAFRRREQS